MTYEAFMAKIKILIGKAGGNIDVNFSNDEEIGKFYARCSDGTTIIGNKSCLKVTVFWNGCNHQSLIAI